MCIISTSLLSSLAAFLRKIEKFFNLKKKPHLYQIVEYRRVFLWLWTETSNKRPRNKAAKKSWIVTFSGKRRHSLKNMTYVHFDLYSPVSSSGYTTPDLSLTPNSSLTDFDPHYETNVNWRWWNVFMKWIVDIVKCIFKLRWWLTFNKLFGLLTVPELLLILLQLDNSFSVKLLQLSHTQQ